MMSNDFNMKFAFVVVLLQFSWCAGQSDRITEMENTINEGVAEALRYKLPTNNEQYRPQNEYYTEGKQILFKIFCLKFNF